MSQINTQPGNPVLVGLMMSGVIAAGIELAGVITGARPENLDFALKFCAPAAGFLVALLSWRDDYPKSLPPGKARLFFKTTYLGDVLFHLRLGILFTIALLHYAFPDWHRAPHDWAFVVCVGGLYGMLGGLSEQAIVRRRWLVLLAPIEIGVAAVLSLLLSELTIDAGCHLWAWAHYPVNPWDHWQEARRAIDEPAVWTNRAVMLGAALIRARQLLALKPGERLRDRLGSWLAAIANGARLLAELIRQAGTLIWRGAIIVGVIWFVFTDPFGWQLNWSNPGFWLGAIEIGLAILCLFCFRHFSEALFMLLVLIIGQPKRRLAPEDLTVAGGRPADPTEAQDFANRQRRHQPPPQFEV